MSLQDDIQALSENGWQALDDSTRARLKASIDIPTIQEISDNGWQGIGDSTKSALREKWSALAAAPPAPVAPKPVPGWHEAIFPALSARYAQESRRAVPEGLDAVTGAAYRPEESGIASRMLGRQWPIARDLLTMPLRAAAGAGAAMGQTMGGAQGLGDLVRGIGLRRPDVSEAYRSAMADPSAAVQEMRGFIPTAQRYLASPDLYAGMAEDVTTLPATALGGTTMHPILQGIAQGAMSAGARSLDRGQLDVAPSDAASAIQLSDLLPAALSAVGPIGSGLKRAGNTWFRQMVKPKNSKGGRELEGFNEALANDLLPKLAGWRLTVGGAGEQFLRNLGKEGGEVQPILATADATGLKVSPAEAIMDAEKAMIQAIKNEAFGGTIAEAKSGLNWVRERAHKPTGENVDLAWRGISVPSNDVLPSIAHRRKSNIYDLVYDRPPPGDMTPLAAKLLAAKEVARSFRRQLSDISPEYAAKMGYLAPLYAAEDAMTTAAGARGNRNVANLMNLINVPAAAQAIWSAGNLLSKAPQSGQRAAVAAGSLLDGLFQQAREQTGLQPDSTGASR